MKFLTKKSAFSLIELSMVIAIIAIIITATIQSSKLIAKSRLATAQSLTESSIVNNLDGLVAWYETSLESSFGNIELEDGVNIATWHDRNPQAVNGNHALMSTVDNQPTFRSGIFNKAIPALNFDGSNDYLIFNGEPLTNSSYTLFIVEKRTELPISGDPQYMLAIHSDVKPAFPDDASLFFGYVSPTKAYSLYLLETETQVMSLIIPTHDHSLDIPTMHSWTSNNTSGSSYWFNGGDIPDDTDNAMSGALEKITNSYIGRKFTAESSPQNIYYKGDIGEIILFNRTLKTSERRAVERYLGEKYGIKVND